LLEPGYLNVRDLLGYDVLVLAKDAVEVVESWLGGAAAAPAGDAGTLAAAGTEE
jgi:hypothetical protein